MEPGSAARSLAFGRIAVGVSLMVVPGVARVWIADAATTSGGRVVVRAFGARDVALGLGLLRALDRGTSARGWLEGGILADAVDFVATLAAGDAIPRAGRLGVLAAAGSGTASGVWLTRSLGGEGAMDAVSAGSGSVSSR